MAKDTRPTQNVALEALRAFVADHGDAFRWSLSKRGRIWLTLTHWDTEKYNTSVELDPMSDAADMVSALAVLCVAHNAKCFGNVAHSDTWLGIEETKNLAAEALDMLTRRSVGPPADEGSTANAPTT